MKIFVAFVLALILASALLPFLALAKSGTVPPPDLTEIMCEQKTDEKGHKYWECFTSLKKKIHVFGTEYFPLEDGRIYIQLLSKDQPVNNALCLIDLYYPDLTVWFDDAAMFYLNGSEGLYYFDVIIPDMPGVYMTTVKCFYIIDETYDYADNAVILHGVETGSYMDTWKDDNQYHEVDEKLVAGGGYALDFYYEFYNVSIPENYTGMTVYWIGRWDSPEEYVWFDVYDWCNDTWVELPNEASTNTPMVSNYIDVSEYNVSCLVSDGTVRVRIHDTNWDEKEVAGHFMTDYIDVQMHYASFGAIENIRGGGELHVRDTSIQTILLKSVEDMITEKLIQNHDYCLDNKTHVKELLIEKCYFGECYNVTKRIVEVCDYGCNVQVGECYPPPYERLGIVIAIIAAIVIIVYLIRRFVW